ncbi:hypothetical protein MHD_04985 [Mannheimia granulomatis]|uniref:Membrane protein n=1 Tax=Mannheimia granulomatis TaxID=85402 RepID=A0A011LX09_9PAST|nr:DUF924 family protein [Mannheimia granulomatis]EXI61758.1 membrane protein [Mannheimia granulomatis]RGE48473.1 hypothetical protein MHD_04985 [Mannheimia granulomatis]
MTPQTILDFWFSPNAQPFWFAKSDEFDQQIRQHFLILWQQAAQGELAEWRATLHGRLAEIIVLDQFSRNLHRNSSQAFAQDLTALILAQEAIKQAGFSSMTLDERRFMLLPFMHSESLTIHRQAVELFAQFTDEFTLEFEQKHLAIIERFGRYPHRNAVLGRISHPEEIEFLKQPNSAF